jgi:hypothetical protein
MTVYGGVAMAAAYLVFWGLIALGHLLFKDHPNFWILTLENLHGAGSLISGVVYFLDEIRRFWKDEDE